MDVNMNVLSAEVDDVAAARDLKLPDATLAAQEQLQMTSLLLSFSVTGQTSLLLSFSVTGHWLVPLNGDCKGLLKVY